MIATVLFIQLLYMCGTCALFCLREETKMKEKNLLTTLKSVPREYELSMEIKPTSFVVNDWTNVIHLTLGGYYENYGDRTPSVWFLENRLQISSAVNGSSMFSVMSSDISLNVWTKVQVIQYLLNENYLYKVQVAGVVLIEAINTDAREFQNVKVYAGSIWTQAQQGFIRNFIINNVCEVNKMELCEPTVKVNLESNWKNNLLIFSIQLNYLYEPGEIAKYVSWEYFLPPFASLYSEDNINGFVKITPYAPKYTVSDNFPTNGFNHNISVTLNVTNCETDGSFSIDIPMKCTYKNTQNITWSQTKTYREKILCPTSKLSKLQINKNNLAESYGRGIYWDENSSHIYVCMSQHIVSSQKAACYYSNNDGELWTGLDVRIGSVVGYHTSTRNLYAVHRSQKNYLMFHNNYKKWFALANNDFFKILNNIDFNALKNIEEDREQIYNLGKREWMGNAVGLYFRNVSGDPWIQRVKWNI